MGGRVLLAAQSALTVGQERAAVFVGVYADMETPLGVALATWLARTLKSGSFETESPLSLTRPVRLLDNVMIQLGGGGLTVVVLLLEVHVDNTTGPDTSHLGTVDSLNLGEDTGRGIVATVLSEESGDVVGLELLCPDIVSRLLEAGLSAPRVDVVTPEVDGLHSRSAVEVVSQVVTDLGIIVGSVTNTDLSVTLRLDVSLGITDRGLDEGTGVGVVSLVGDFVTSKEA